MIKRTTINDLAKALELSPTLISMVLNGKGDKNKISKQTQKRVFDIARKMNYTPNQNARALRTGKTNVIGLIVPDISNPFYSRISRDLEDLLGTSGYRLILGSTDEDPEKEKKLIKLFLDQNVDGIISASTLTNDKAYLEVMGAGKVVILFDRVFPKSTISSVSVQNSQGAYIAVENLAKKGKKNIGYLTLTPQHISPLADRKTGFTEAMKKMKLKFSPSSICEIRFDEVDGGFEKNFSAWIKKNPQLDAIVVANNSLAVQVLKYYKDQPKAKRPSIVSFDDHVAFEVTSPSITAITQPVDEIATKTVQVLLETLEDKTIKPKHIVLPVGLELRESHK
ncbi:MAG TPA: LacI family DNA-binding transcriptional regulator [Flavobacteriales bacterium]|nr:LacI family DNA-binding transcriptional regulator [Flavobacteriales bacterium]